MPPKLKGKTNEPSVQPGSFDLSVLKKFDFSKIKRSDLLPAFFSINSKPYSLDNFLQFKTLFDGDYVPESIYISGRQVSKSVSLSRYEVLNCLMLPHYKVLYVAPLKEQATRFSVMYLREAIQTCAFARMLQDKNFDKSPSAGPILKSITHQAFSNGSDIQLTYAKTSADRARGIMCDELDCDEIQDHLIDNLAIIKKSLTQSDWGIRRYTGTAKTVDNTIEYLWQQSSKAEWAMKCSGCGYWNIPNLDGHVLDMIQINGPCCVRCGKLLDVRNGQFVHEMPGRAKSFVGYHIPQIIIPNIVLSERRWSEVVNAMLKEPPATFMQEVLGISNSTGARLISMKDIEKCCLLPDMADMQKKLSGYAMTIGGVDWGVAEQTSFTVHTIIGIRPDGKLDVVWAKRFAGFDPDEVMSQIVKAQKFYKCKMLAADFGMGFDKNCILASRYGLPVIQIQYTRQNQFMNYRPLLGYPRWMVDKTTALELMFLGIRSGCYHFPPMSDFKTYAEDLLSPYEAVVETGGSNVRKFVRNPSSPDDFAHALCFATLAAMRMSGCSLLDLAPSALKESLKGVPDPSSIDPREALKASM
jgi:hypothetical protein